MVYDSNPMRASLQYTPFMEYINDNRDNLHDEMREWLLRLRDEGVSGGTLFLLAWGIVNQGVQSKDKSYFMGMLRNIVSRSEQDVLIYSRLREQGFIW